VLEAEQRGWRTHPSAHLKNIFLKAYFKSEIERGRYRVVYLRGLIQQSVQRL